MPKAKTYSRGAHRKVVREAKKEHQPRVTYHDGQGMRNGFLVEDTGKHFICRFVGDLKNTRISYQDKKYLKVLA